MFATNVTAIRTYAPTGTAKMIMELDLSSTQYGDIIIRTPAYLSRNTMLFRLYKFVNINHRAARMFSLRCVPSNVDMSSDPITFCLTGRVAVLHFLTDTGEPCENINIGIDLILNPPLAIFLRRLYVGKCMGFQSGGSQQSIPHPFTNIYDATQTSNLTLVTDTVPHASISLDDIVLVKCQLHRERLTQHAGHDDMWSMWSCTFVLDSISLLYVAPPSIDTVDI
ncbi:hypothetical protein A0H81_03466 [Grifola frondosa]|uniref:Uncharacterized protein n=1 Tax=Grifola frondosa TaxID=5627 RepID=A0A1C7MJC4_GRIFR|nr:hypothetical protein A0H81_03466 [Grifola frondosa]